MAISELLEAALTYKDMKAIAKKAGSAWVAGLKKIKPAPVSVTLVKSDPSMTAGWDYTIYSLAEVVLKEGSPPIRVGMSVSAKEGEEASGSVSADSLGVIATFRGSTYEQVSKKLIADSAEHLSKV